VTLTFKFLHKIVVMDHKRALPVITQLDYWTSLIELLQLESLRSLERHENRVILKQLKQSHLRQEDPCHHEDMVVLSANAIIELIFEAFKRDSQLANMLVKTTKLLNNLFDCLKEVVDHQLSLLNKSLLIVFFDKLVKLLHVALMHPRDFTTEALTKFLTSSQTGERRNWVYITEMFRLINDLSASCSYAYGQVDVKLGVIRFIAEYLLRVEGAPCLDEMVARFEGQKYFDENEVFSREDLRTYGSLILLEMGMVFKSLYLDKDARAVRRDPQESENSMIDICISLCILLSKSKSAKTVAIEQHLAKKVLEIC